MKCQLVFIIVFMCIVVIVVVIVVVVVLIIVVHCGDDVDDGVEQCHGEGEEGQLGVGVSFLGEIFHNWSLDHCTK